MTTPQAAPPWAGLPNPFEDQVARNAWDRAVDVESIHAPTFERLLGTFERVAHGPGSRALLLHGPAGSGKTHLLGRLRARLEADEEAPDRLGHGVFVYVRLDTNPERIWQHLQQRLVDDLLRKESGLSQLQRIIAHELAQHRGEEPRRWIRELRVLIRLQAPELSSILEEIEDRAQLGREVRTVIEHLMFNRKRADAKAWLRGDFLPEDALRSLGVDPSADVTADPEDRAKEAVLALLRIPSHSLPIVVCFDQVESLQRHNQDTEALFRFGRAAADMVDTASNLFLISCVQTAFVDQLKQAVRRADLDRIAASEAKLDAMSVADAEALLRARLDAIPEFRELRAGKPPLYPFPSAMASTVLAGGNVGPRAVLARASQELERLRHGDVDAIPVDEFLELEFDRRLEDAEVRPIEIEATLAHGLPLLFGLSVSPWSVSSERSPRDVSVRLEKGAERLDIAVCNETDGRALRFPLTRLAEQFDPHRAGLRIIRDSARPIRATAVKSKEALDGLLRSGARRVHPDASAIAALEALRTLLSDAKAGDLTLRGTPIPVDTVAEWLQLQFQSQLAALPDFVERLTEMGPNENEEPPLLAQLLELVSEQRLMTLNEAAQRLGAEPGQVEDLAESDPGLGIIEGTPSILFAPRERTLIRRSEEEGAWA